MKTIKLFGLALEGNNFDYKLLSEEALKQGYIVDKECSTKEVYDFLKSIKINTNTTFYRTWQDITSKNRLELFIDQVIHYSTTYGTNFESKEVYIPNESFGKDDNFIDFKNFKTIKVATQEEIIEKCNGMLSSGIALNEETITDLFDIYYRFNYLPNIEMVKNKESKMRIYHQRNILPKNNEEFIRFLVFLATEKTLLIKDKKTLDLIKNSQLDISNLIEKFGFEKLSESFFRFKNIFLAFKKKNKINAYSINKLRKLADKFHKPYKKTFFENILNDFSKISELPEKLKELNNFKKVSLIESIRQRISHLEYNSYIIRNGKFFIKENKNTIGDLDKIPTYKLMESIIYNSLIESIKNKFNGKTFYIPDYLDIKVPKSEKTFIGDVSMGTEVKIPNDDLIVGAYWRGEDGTDDYDLSFLCSNGTKLGWDSDYYNGDKTIVYSGDMTFANPEATELFYFSKEDKNTDGLFYVNNFRGGSGSKFKLIIGKEKINDIHKFKNHMLSKENIIFSADLTAEYRENIVGVKSNGSFIIQKVVSSNKRVSSGSTITEMYSQYVIENQNNLLSLKKVLEDSGLVFVNKLENNDNIINFDFSDIKKDTIISLLS